MAEFKRSPSKVWWASESLEWREVSESPRSHDSGFSDAETSPKAKTVALRANDNDNGSNESTSAPFLQDLRKDIAPSSERPENLSKDSPPDDKCTKSPFDSSMRRTFTKNSPRVSRNLFRSRRNIAAQESKSPNQYSKDGTRINTWTSSSSSDCGSYQCDLGHNLSSDYHHNRTFPECSKNVRVLNQSAPSVLENNKDEVDYSNDQSFSSDCESELECLFNGALDVPRHTSTPKATPMRTKRVFGGTKTPLNVLLNHQQARIPRLPFQEIETNVCLEEWFKETRHSHYPECTITLQTKSIAGEHSQKVATLAGQITATIRNILNHSSCIQIEYQKLNSDRKHVGPLVQSFAGNIMSYYQNFVNNDALNSKIDREYDEIRKSPSLKQIATFFDTWQQIHQSILSREATCLVARLENPTSELDVKATTTGLTSICLRCDNFTEIVRQLDVIPVLLVLCEKCEGSSLRSVLLRALSTICGTAAAVRQFEKFSGLEIVNDTLAEETRPEPERAEAVALLAQVTAPWIEDNHCLRGLEEHSRKLVKSLTKFANSIKCCQNLLLCTAALANLSSLDSKCLKFMISARTVEILLDAIDRRGPRVTIYLLEQVTCVIANMTALDVGRKRLASLKVPGVLLKFLKINGGNNGEDVERRLQQKAVIALSRLCGEETAALQVVNLGGIEKLVKICRNRNERFDSDAVLVASLATLRKITDICGTQVISREDAQELIEPKLLDSFFAYSTQSESYV